MGGWEKKNLRLSSTNDESAMKAESRYRSSIAGGGEVMVRVESFDVTIKTFVRHCHRMSEMVIRRASYPV